MSGHNNHTILLAQSESTATDTATLARPSRRLHHHPDRAFTLYEVNANTNEYMLLSACVRFDVFICVLERPNTHSSTSSWIASFCIQRFSRFARGFVRYRAWWVRAGLNRTQLSGNNPLRLLRLDGLGGKDGCVFVSIVKVHWGFGPSWPSKFGKNHILGNRICRNNVYKIICFYLGNICPSVKNLG